MPLREFSCTPCNAIGELLHPSFDPAKVPAPDCPLCGQLMELEISLPNVDTSSSFKGCQTYNGPDGRVWNIDSLHKMRQVEKAYQATGHDVRFDAYSANPSNPDPVNGFGPEYWDGTKNATGKRIVSLPSK